MKIVENNVRRQHDNMVLTQINVINRNATNEIEKNKRITADNNMIGHSDRCRTNAPARVPKRCELNYWRRGKTENHNIKTRRHVAIDGSSLGNAFWDRHAGDHAVGLLLLLFFRSNGRDGRRRWRLLSR